jgi:hypothetical protein
VTGPAVFYNTATVKHGLFSDGPWLGPGPALAGPIIVTGSAVF